MTRDMELVRQILLWTEAKADPDDMRSPVFEGYDPEFVSYHVHMLWQRGLLVAYDMQTNYRIVVPKELTWEGHDFLDAIRKDTVWQKLKAKIAEKGGNMPFDLIKETAMVLTREYFTS